MRKRENEFKLITTIVKYLVISLIRIAQDPCLGEITKLSWAAHKKGNKCQENYASEWEYCKDNNECITLTH